MAVTTKQIKAAQAVADKAQAAYAAAKTKQKRPGSKVTNLQELYVAQRETTNTVNKLMEEFTEQNKTPPEISTGQKTSEGLFPDLRRGETGTKREVAKAAKAKAAKAKAAKAKARGKKAQESPGSGSSPTGAIGKLPRGPAGPTGKGVKLPRGPASPTGKDVKLAKKQPLQSKAKKYDDGVPSPRKAYTQDGTEKKKDSLESALDSVKSLVSSVTPKMESFFGLNRSDEQIEKDMAVTAELEERDFRGGKKKGGRVSKPSRKKYSMNKGGKVASVRKPTRA
jgi:hypothetical protein